MLVSAKPFPLRKTGKGLLNQLGHVVEALKASFGVQVSANGEQLILVDESGSPIRDEVLTALMINMVLTAHPRGTVVVPINTSSAVEQIARRHDAKVIRTKANPTALMEACHQNEGVVIGGVPRPDLFSPTPSWLRRHVLYCQAD